MLSEICALKHTKVPITHILYRFLKKSLTGQLCNFKHFLGFVQICFSLFSALQTKPCSMTHLKWFALIPIKDLFPVFFFFVNTVSFKETASPIRHRIWLFFSCKSQSGFIGSPVLGIRVLISSIKS